MTTRNVGDIPANDQVDMEDLSGVLVDGQIPAGIARLASPALTGNPTAPTAAPGDSDTSIATTAFAAAAVAAEAAARAASEALLAPLASPAFTGNPTAPTPTTGDSDTSVATTAHVHAVADAKVTQTITNGVTTTAPSEDAVFDALALKAPLASPTFTGTVTVPASAAVTDAAQRQDTWTEAGINAQVASYTLVLADAGKLVTINNAGATTLSIPTDASVAFPVGTRIDVAWITGAGQPTIAAVTPGTTTVLSTGATVAQPKLRAVNSGATLMKIAANTWLVFGDLS